MDKKNCKLFLKNPSMDPITQKKIIKGKSTYNKWINQSKEYGLIKKTKIQNKKCSKIPLPEKNDKWTIYTIEWCGYCKGTKELLKQKKEKYVEHDVSNIVYITECLGGITNNYEMFPMIFKNGEFIGGLSELKNIL